MLKYVVAHFGRNIGVEIEVVDGIGPTIGENRQLVTDELVEFEISPVEVQDSRKITDHFRGILWNIPQFNKGKPEDVNM